MPSLKGMYNYKIKVCMLLIAFYYYNLISTFNMDEFKKVYSNEEESKSIAYFWEHFDKKNYSIWFGEFKYNNELQKVFMSCNLISGKFI